MEEAIFFQVFLRQTEVKDVRTGGCSRASGNMKSRGVRNQRGKIIENFSSEIRQVISR